MIHRWELDDIDMRSLHDIERRLTEALDMLALGEKPMPIMVKLRAALSNLTILTKQIP